MPPKSSAIPARSVNSGSDASLDASMLFCVAECPQPTRDQLCRRSTAPPAVWLVPSSASAPLVGAAVMEEAAPAASSYSTGGRKVVPRPPAAALRSGFAVTGRSLPLPDLRRPRAAVVLRDANMLHGAGPAMRAAEGGASNWPWASTVTLATGRSPQMPLWLSPPPVAADPRSVRRCFVSPTSIEMTVATSPMGSSKRKRPPSGCTAGVVRATLTSLVPSSEWIVTRSGLWLRALASLSPGTRSAPRKPQMIITFFTIALSRR
mmetsp:Transcript_57907/g.148970  ORF Transcript_57907/g.148970 Transcript_57907/m.148970 type:complete len:263 (-) Transcript_57907:414-1202(-)